MDPRVSTEQVFILFPFQIVGSWVRFDLSTVQLEEAPQVTTKLLIMAMSSCSRLWQWNT